MAKHKTKHRKDLEQHHKNITQLRADAVAAAKAEKTSAGTPTVKAKGKRNVGG